MRIICAGSVAFDYLMTFPGLFKDHILVDKLETISLSFLVDSMRKYQGGVSANISFTNALLGGSPVIWATVGEDFEEYGEWLTSKGIDISGAKVIRNEFTASFFVNTDHNNAQIASFYPGAMGYAAQHSLRNLDRLEDDLVVISPTDPEAMKLYVDECSELGISFVYDPSQQIVRLEGKDIASGILNARALFVNDYEFCLVEKMTGWNADMMINRNPGMFIVITKGAEGVTVKSGEEEFRIPAVTPESINDPTGVGDAFRGGFLRGFQLDLDLRTCAQMGSVAAAFCLENMGPQSHQYSLEDFINRFEKSFPGNHALRAVTE
jgi:adenosine kinase